MTGDSWRESEREVWNRKYGAGGVTLGMKPSAFLVACLPTVRAGTQGRRALDVACGEGRNSLYLASNGFATLGVDVSDVGLDRARQRAEEAGLIVDFRRADLREDSIEGVFDLIVVFNFLLRPLLPELASRLAPSGYLILESMMQEFDEAGAPRHRPEFTVEPDELACLVSDTGLRVLRQEHDLQRAKARVLAQRL